MQAIDSGSGSGRRAVRVGGAALIGATLLFIAVFGYLAARFGYPDVLDRPAAEVLPRLLALGDTGRTVWWVYALVPLLLLPTARGVDAAARQVAPRATQVARVSAALAALCMMAGLLRWPTLQWQLALAWGDAAPAAREGLAATFALANRWLGNVIGEFLGELFLNSFFLAATLALVRADRALAPAGTRARWLLPAGVLASALGFVALWRNTVPWLGPVAELNNGVLPLWMLVLGGALATHGRRADRSIVASAAGPAAGSAPAVSP